MRADLEQRLGYCRNLLPTLPAVALRIINLANDPDTDVGEIAKVIALDPALVVKLLRVANSPFYGRRRKSENLRQAINLLGVHGTLTIALSFSLSASLQSAKWAALDSVWYWRRSIIAAVVSRHLGEQQGLAELEELFLAGLLQDIGMLVFDTVMPTEYGVLIASIARGEEPAAGQLDYERLVAAERELLGADHMEVGSWLLRQWNLPEYLWRAVAGSENPTEGDMSAKYSGIVSCVAVSGRVADYWLNPEDDGIWDRAVQSAKQWLKMSASNYLTMLENVAADLPAVSAMFEMQLVDPVQLTSILADAKEILQIHALQVLQEAAEVKQRTELLETRARKLEEQSRLDPLTGLYNRGWLDGSLDAEFRRASENNWPLSIAFIDLDYFKNVNDQYGHQAGDEVLVTVARLLSQCLRRNDIIARYGGDEFLIVLPGVGLDLAGSLLKRVLDTMRETDYAVGSGVGLRVTVSIGLASHQDKGYRFDNIESLVRAADQMVYIAKRQGRDSLVVYPGSP